MLLSFNILELWLIFGRFDFDENFVDSNFLCMFNWSQLISFLFVYLDLTLCYDAYY